MLEKKKVDDVAATAPNLTTVHGKPTQSRMYSGSHSLDERVATYGRPASLAYTLPPAAGKQADDIEAEKKRFDGTTTNRFFYEDLPAQARSSPPKQGYFDTTLDDTKHRKTMNLEREKAFFATDGAAFISPYLATSTRSTGAGTGKMGRMGDFTRNPKEAGSVYGVSIWADEYAQWGNKLKGKTLGETRSKAMTKHF